MSAQSHASALRMTDPVPVPHAGDLAGYVDLARKDIGEAVSWLTTAKTYAPAEYREDTQKLLAAADELHAQARRLMEKVEG